MKMRASRLLFSAPRTRKGVTLYRHPLSKLQSNDVFTRPLHRHFLGLFPRTRTLLLGFCGGQKGKSFDHGHLEIDLVIDGV